jgi:hypothetical protein
VNLRKRRTEASERFAERRRREDSAPRLKERVPELAELKLEVEEGGAKHIRHIVLDRAPALFVFPCGDPSCQGGGYEITDAIMHGLQTHTERFEADDRCLGSVGHASCTRTLHAVALARYSK